jgi:hypothetical protein
MDPDGLGICCWPAVLSALTNLSAVPEWDCPACTFHNGSAAKTCEMCASGRPAAAPKAAASNEAKSPREFYLYHFNGIDGHGKVRTDRTAVCAVLRSGRALTMHRPSVVRCVSPFVQAVAECRRVKVVILGDVQPGIDTLKPGLREVLQTKWNNAAIEYIGAGEPKVN